MIIHTRSTGEAAEAPRGAGACLRPPAVMGEDWDEAAGSGARALSRQAHLPGLGWEPPAGMCPVCPAAQAWPAGSTRGLPLSLRHWEERRGV